MLYACRICWRQSPVAVACKRKSRMVAVLVMLQCSPIRACDSVYAGSHLLAPVAHCCRGGSQFVQSDSLASLRHLMCTIHLRRPTPFGVLQKAMSSQFRVIMTDTKPAVYLSTFASIDDMCVVLQHTAHASKSNQFALTQFAAPVRDSDAHAWT